MSFSWEEEALRYAKNADYWRERAEDAERALAAKEVVWDKCPSCGGVDEHDEANMSQTCEPFELAWVAREPETVDGDELGSLRTRLAEAEEKLKGARQLNAYLQESIDKNADVAILRHELKQAEQRGRALEKAAREHCEALRAIPYNEHYAEECCVEVERLLALTPAALSAPPPGG